MRISTRLVLGFAVLVLLVVATGGFGLYQNRATNRSIGTVYADRVVPLKQLKVVSNMNALNVIDTANKFSRAVSIFKLSHAGSVGSAQVRRKAKATAPEAEAQASAKTGTDDEWTSF